MAVIAALLRIYIQYLAFPLWQTGAIVQYLSLIHISYPGIDVGVRMSVYPIVYAAIGDIVLQLYGERHVCLAALKLWVDVYKRQCS